MPTLGFLNVGGKKYSLKYGESYVIGFTSDDYAHDIEIDDASVDVKHCVLDFTEPIPKIFDIKSKCGTFVDHERVPACCMFPLKKSTNIRIGYVDAILQLPGEGDSGFLEGRLSPPEKDNGPEKDASMDQLEPAECGPTNSSTGAPNPDHQFLVPTAIVRRSTGRSTTNESFDSFSIPETQMPAKDALPQDDDDEDSFFIPETQDVVTATAALCNYPRVAFENEDVNETVADCDKIPSSQFRICTQDFNGSDDELSNHSDDILANVPCSLVIPTIRHSPVQINDISRRQENAEIEREMSALQWSKTTEQTTHNASTPDGICTPDDLVFPNQEQLEVPKPSSQCSTPDIFADQEPAVDDMDKSLKENDPPPVVVGFMKEPHAIHRPSVKKASSTPNCRANFEEISVEKSQALPPTQLFVLPPQKPKQPPVVVEKQKPTSIMDDDLPPTQVFEPVPAKSKANVFLSSTLVDPGMQLSENSFKAKCNKLLDSDDDEMDEVVAPDLVQKYRESLESAKDLKKSTADDCIASPQENKNVSKDIEKMLPPKNKPIQAVRDNVVASAQKLKTNNCDARYVNIEAFLCTPDFLGKEFAKDENLQKRAELMWKNQRKTLFDEETPTKPEKCESDDSQDSFIDLIPRKKKQEESAGEQAEDKGQKEPVRKEPPKEVEARGSRRRRSSLRQDAAEKDLPQTKSADSKAGKKQGRSKRATETAGDQNEESPREKKSKEFREEQGRSRQTSANKTEDNADAKRAEEKVVKATAKRKTRHRAAAALDVKVGKQMASLDDPLTSKKESAHKLNHAQVPVENCKSSASFEGKTSADQKWTEKRILEVVLNKNGTKKTTDGLSRTRSKTKSSEVPPSSNASSEESVAVSRKVAEKKRSNTSSDEKKLNSAEEAKMRPEQEQTVKKETERVRKRMTVNKIEEEDTEKPQKRVTRLRSGKPTEATPPEDQPADPKQVKSSRQTRGRVKTPKETEKDKPKHGTVDLTESDNEDRPNPGTTSNGVKRKNNEEEVESKRTRSASSESIQQTNLRAKSKLKIAMTMCDPRYQEVLEKHSGSLWVYTKDPKECDVLVLEKGNRTYKLMVAIARGIPVIKLDWLVEVLKRKSIAVPMEEYLFQDQQFQERHQFLMKKSLFLAKTTSLFKGIAFMTTPNIRPSPSEMKDIITCAGGTVLEQMPKQKQRIYLVSQTKDNQYWHQYRRSNSNVKIVTTEGVMASVMQQSEAPLIKSIIQ